MSIARFVRGLDLTDHALNVGLALNGVGEMVNLEWIRLDRTKLTYIPEELFRLRKLKRLTLSNNQVDRLATELANFAELEKLTVRRNIIHDIPESLFRRLSLHTLVLAHNDLKEIPDLVHLAKELRRLSLAYNGITEVGTDACRRLTHLTYLDLSGNEIRSLPPQFRRLDNLQVLILADNPLGDCNLKSICYLKLRKLNLSRTQRTQGHFPFEFQELQATLVDLDISMNDLGVIPAAVYSLKLLERLNVAHNKIPQSGILPSAATSWPGLETLNLTGNELTDIPLVVCHMTKLKRLYLNANNITEYGFPTKLARLNKLHTLMLAGNKLETLPRFVCLMNLKKISLKGNELTNLPVEIHLLLDNAKLCDLSENPFLKMPPKPRENVIRDPYYGADFSLQASEQYAARVLAEEQTRMRIDEQKSLGNYQKSDEDDDRSKLLLKAMAEQAGTQTASDTPKSKIFQENEPAGPPPPPPRNWQDSLVRPDIDYSAVFNPDVGKTPGLEVFIIDNLNPRALDSVHFGKFCVADCYIVLNTTENITGQLQHNIFFWIGGTSTIDKRACAAIHAVNLRNSLGVRSRDQRQTQGEESQEFMHLFRQIEYIDEKEATNSGLYQVSLEDHPTRLFALVFDGKRARLDQIEPRRASLHSAGAFVLETKNEIFVWLGQNATLQAKAKARLLAETINSNDYKSRATVSVIEEADTRNKALPSFNQHINEQEAQSRRLEQEEQAEIRRRAGITEQESQAAQEIGQPLSAAEQEFRAQLAVSSTPQARRNTVYEVVMGQGYLELPQIYGRLKRELLRQECCYIIDSNAQIFLWVGRKSGRDFRLAAQKLALEIYNLIPRPKWAKVTRILDRAETEIFKKLFDDWDEIITVDHSRRVGHVSEVTSNEPPKMDVDVRAIYKPPQKAIDDSTAMRFIEQSNGQLEGINCFIFDGRKFKALPSEEKGIFFVDEVYAFLCKYYVDSGEEEKEDDDDDDDEEGEESRKGAAGEGGNKEHATEQKRKIKLDCVLYYWEGRTASPMGWLNFKFQFLKTMETLVKETYGTELKVVRTQQQKEPIRLLAHFERKIIVHLGQRTDLQNKTKAVSMYHVRHGAAIVSLRAIEVLSSPKSLVSRDCFLIRDPQSHTITLWVGQGASRIDESHAMSLLPLIWPEAAKNHERVLPVYDGQEPGAFWLMLGGQAPHDKSLSPDNSPLRPRLFRCSNSTGAFKVIEIIDFCQDDLSSDDVMIVDPGSSYPMYMWIGTDASSVEVHMSKRVIEVYLEQCRDGRTEATHCIRISKGTEPLAFKGLFHGWNEATRREDPKNEFLRNEKLFSGRVVVDE